MIRIFTAFFLLLTAALPLPLWAGSVREMVEARLLPGWQMPDGSHMTALHLKLKDGWKTYWRAPGDAGIPPNFNWSGSGNLAGVEVQWPTPHVIMQQGVRTIGYTGQLILPLKLTPKQAGQQIMLQAEIDIGVCSDICVPVTLNLRQDLPRGNKKPDPRIVAAMAERPSTAREANVSRVTCVISAMEDGLHLRAEVDLPQLGPDEIAILETADPRVGVAQSSTRRIGGRLIAEADLYHVEGRSFALQRTGLRLTILSGKKAVDIQGCPAG
jgi:DsbC/DsbD-like thiol-disulfide interchange protein